MIIFHPGMLIRLSGKHWFYDDICQTLTAFGGDNIPVIVADKRTFCFTPGMLVRFGNRPSDDICGTLTRNCSDNLPCVAYVEDNMDIYEHHPQDARVRKITDDTAPTITTKTCNCGNSMPIVHDGEEKEDDGYIVRRLTPVECERLQGFPDGFTDIPYRGKPHSPDSQRYKAIGNSMAVPVMRWIGRRIEDSLEEEKEADPGFTPFPD